MRDYIKLLRIKHYIKNILIFAALVFSGQLLNSDKILESALGFIAFCLISSVVYIINDILDRKKDINHPTKKNRPIASGRISVPTAIVVASICLALSIGITVYFFNCTALLLLATYLLLNILYSFRLKEIPLLDVLILVSGFVIRVIFGGVITGIEISSWLYLTVISFSFSLAFGKRRNEFQKLGNANTRKVLTGYTLAFLDKSMYMCLTLANVFYSLWSVDYLNNDSSYLRRRIFTVPLVLIISLRYSMNIEKETSDGDPVEVLLSDKALFLLCAIYATIMMAMLYYS